MIPQTSPKVRSRISYPSGFLYTSNTNCENSGQVSPTSQTFYPTIPRSNIMVGNDIKFPIFNENGLEDPKKHWFLCEPLWTMRQVQDEAIKKVQMITSLMGRVLDWYMKFSVVSIGIPKKTLNQIRIGLIDKCRKPTSVS